MLQGMRKPVNDDLSRGALVDIIVYTSSSNGYQTQTKQLKLKKKY